MKYILKSVLTLSTIILTLVSVHAGESVFNYSADQSFVFSYSSRVDHKAEINNFFIKELAKINVNSLSRTLYTYYYGIEQNIQKIAANTFSASAKITGDNCTGDIYYKGFDISDILKPEYVDFTAVVVDQGNYIQKINFSDIRIDEQNNAEVSFNFETWDDSRKFKLILKNINFYSDSGDQDFFFNRLSAIDNFYASIDAMDIEAKKLGKHHVLPQNIESSLILLSEAQRLVSNIKSSSFSNYLLISGDKKKIYDEQLHKLNTAISKFQNAYLEIVNTSNFIKISQSYSALAKEFVNESGSFNILSQDVSHSNQSYFYYLGTTARTSSSINTIKNGIKKILLKTKYCNDTQTVLNRLKREIYLAYLQKSDQLSTDQNYHQSRGVLIQALNFHNLTMGTGVPLDLNIAFSKANYGIYNSYLHLIDRAIDIGNYELAENYIQKAGDFQELNTTTIISGQYMGSVYNELVKLYINKGISLNQEEAYDEAAYCFQQAQAVSNRLGIFNHDYIIKHGLDEARNGMYATYLTRADQYIEEGQENMARENLENANDLANKYPSQIRHLSQIDSLTNRFNYQLYLNRIADGKKYQTEGNYNEAYLSFLSALIIESKSSFPIYEPLVDLFADAAVPYLKDQCKMGELMVKQNRLDEARQIYDSVFQLQSDFGLYYERELQSGLALLNNSIFSKQCDIASKEFGQIIERFENAVEAGDFISAMAILDESDELAHKNYYCDIDQSKVALLQKEYEPAAEYQKLASEAQKALSTNDYKQFTEIYQKLEDLSARYEIIRKRIEPMPLHYLFSIKKNLAILESSLNQYQNEDDLALALRILQVMETSNISGRDAKGLQEKLGKKLAYIDRSEMQSDNPKANVEKYTGGSSWYKHFKKAYIKNW